MWMLRALVNLELGNQCATEAIVRNHPLHCAFDQKFWVPSPALTKGLALVPTDVTGERHVALRRLFFSSDADLVCIDDNDEITSIDMRGENRFFFTTQKVGSLDRHAPKNLVSGVNDPPTALHFVCFR